MGDIIKHEGGYEVADIREQICLLKKFGLPETAIDRNYVRVDKSPSGKEVYVLCKRENPIKVSDPYDDNCRVTSGMKSYSEQMGFDSAKKRGKYNDEDRLAGTEALSIKVGEVESWANM